MYSCEPHQMIKFHTEETHIVTEQALNQMESINLDSLPDDKLVLEDAIELDVWESESTDFRRKLNNITIRVDTLKQEFLFKVAAWIKQINPAKGEDFADEIHFLLQDYTQHVSPPFALLFFFLLRPQDTPLQTPSQKNKNVSIYTQLQQKLESWTDKYTAYLCQKEKELFKVLIQKPNKRIDVAATLMVTEVREWVKLLIEFLIRNECKLIAKQLFKQLPLDLLEETVLQNKRLNSFENAFFVESILNLVHQREYVLKDRECIQTFYVSFLAKMTGLNKGIGRVSISKNNDFLKSVIQLGCERIALTYYQHSNRLLCMSRQVLLLIIHKKMYCLLLSLVSDNHLFLNQLFLDKELFQTLFLPNDDLRLFMYQLQILKKAIGQPNQRFSEQVLTQVLDKFQAFLQEESVLWEVFVNSLFIQCNVSLLLVQFVEKTHHRFDQFKSLSFQYKARAQSLLSCCNNDQSLHLLLMETAPLQDQLLVSILFDHMDHWDQILNTPILLKVIKYQWKGNLLPYTTQLNDNYQHKLLFSSRGLLIKREESNISQMIKASYSHNYKPTLSKSMSAALLKDRTKNRITMRSLCTSDLTSIQSNQNRCRKMSFIKVFQNSDQEETTQWNVFKYLGERPQQSQEQCYLYQYDYYLEDNSLAAICKIVILFCYTAWFMQVAHLESGEHTPERMGGWQVVCVLTMQTGLKGFYEALYSLLSRRRLPFSYEILYDMLIIFSCVYMLHSGVGVTQVRFCSTLVVLCLYCKIITNLSFIQTIGIYTIVIGKVLRELSMFLFMFLSVLLVLALCFNLLFRDLVKEQKSLLLSFLTEVASPLGMVSLVNTQGSAQAHLLQHYNTLQLLTTFFIMVILLNILIAMLTNVYQKIVQSTEREFSHSLYEQYHLHRLQGVHSYLVRCPIFLTLPLAPLLLLLCLRSKQLNDRLHRLIYFLTVLLPVLVLYFLANLLVLPLTYSKLLLNVTLGHYKDQFHQPQTLPPKTRALHFALLFFLGPFFLLHQLITVDCAYILEKAFEKVPPQTSLLFDRRLYGLFKSSLFSLAASAVPLETFLCSLDSKVESLPRQEQIHLQERLELLKNRLKRHAKEHQGQVQLPLFRQVLRSLKGQDNKQRKMKQMQMVFNRWEEQYNH